MNGRRLRFISCAGLFSLLPTASPGYAAVPHPEANQVRAAVDTVYARPEFAPGDEPTHWNWLLDFLQWLGNLRHTNESLFWVLVITCFSLLALILTHIGWTLRRALASDRSFASPDAAAERARRSQAYRQQALRAAEAGDFTEAVRFLFLSLVYRYDESGRVNFQRAYTNREYLSFFEDRPAARADLAVFVDTLDDNWYGQHPTARQRYEQCLSLYDKLTRS